MKLRSRVLLFTAFGCLLLFRPSLARAQSAPTAPRPITIDDDLQVRDVEDPQISADGTWVAYTVETASLKTTRATLRFGWRHPRAESRSR